MATAVASPTRIPPSSQTMDSTLSPPRPDSNPILPPRPVSRTPSFSKPSDLQSSGSLKSEEYRQLFRLPADEVLLQDFNCALQENILLQGHMYLFDHYICFYSNIFGYETKKIIPFQDVTSVKRAKTVGLIPNAIEIVAAGKKHFFASFLSRDEAYKLITDGWSQHGDLNGSLDRQDSKSETSSQLNGVLSENTDGSDSPISELDSGERNMDLQVNDNVLAAATQVSPVAEERTDASTDSEPSTSSSSVKWVQETRDAPEIPKCYTKVAETKLPISVEQFFNLFFSDDGVSFVDSYHKKCGDREFKCAPWTPHDNFGYTRVKTFQHPIKIYLGARCGGCKETQKFRVYKNSHLVIETSQEVSDVPYADYFTVEGFWDVQKDGDSGECCVLKVYVTVSFSKNTMWKGKIEKSTMEECRDSYATWTHLAHDLLKKKNIEKIEELATTSIVQKLQVDPGNAGRGEARVDRLDGIPVPGSTNSVGSSRVVHEEAGNPLLSNLLHIASTILSLLKASALKFASFLKRHGSLQLFLVIAFSVILLLMQISIVVLLSRPQQVLVVSQPDPTISSGFGVGQKGAEATRWIEKRMHLLKDEMILVESQLERMRQEHVLLKAHLKDLERLTKQHS